MLVQLTAGLMFGIAGVIGVASPYHLDGGLLIDGRNVVIAVGTVMGGPLAGAVCTIFTLSYRFHVGGVGAPLSSIAMLVTFAMSVGFRQFWQMTGRSVTATRLGILGLCVALANLVRYALLPGDGDAEEALQTVTLPLLVLTPLGTYLAGAAALWSQHKEELQARLARSNRELEHANEVAVAARREAEQANLAKSQFLAGMSHELRTPLNAIIGFSEIMKTELFGAITPTRYADYARHIHDGGQHLLSLINDVLDLSKIEAGRMTIAIETLSAEETCRRALDMVHALAASRHVELTSTIEPGLSTLRGDDRAVQQILLNLLSNAIKFTGAGGRVHLAVARGKSGVTITVTDSGIGMTPAEMARALEPYGQVDSKLARRSIGTGLGLPLAKSLAELHGGSLSLSSEPGVGTSVSVLLPWHIAAQSGPPARPLAAAE
ncbi:MAG: ATP-binding protein [Dongiaceae bacterium]